MSAQTIAWSGETARLASWRGDRFVAHLSPTASAPLSPGFVSSCLGMLRDEGYRSVVTSALSRYEAEGFLRAGFDVYEQLDLLVHDLGDIPAGPARLRRARPADRGAVLDIDAMSFPPFWCLQEGGLTDALTATPHVRFRTAAGAGMPIAGFSITGRGSGTGYIQRLAVHPSARGRGIARGLVADGLRWMRRRGARRAFVNTQQSNTGALALYRACGFRLLPDGLQILVRAL